MCLGGSHQHSFVTAVQGSSATLLCTELSLPRPAFAECLQSIRLAGITGGGWYNGGLEGELLVLLPKGREEM